MSGNYTYSMISTITLLVQEVLTDVHTSLQLLNASRVCVYVCVCMYVCMYVRMYVCIVCVCVCMYVSVCIYVCMYVRMYIRTYMCII